MRVALVCLVALAAGCLAAEVPLAAQSVDGLPSAAASPSGRLSFHDVQWEPSEPASGDEIVISARVAGRDLRPDYTCNVVVTRDGARGGGLLSAGLLSRGDDDRWRCVVPAASADAIAFFLVGHDGEQWVRSDYFVVPLANGPGSGRPGPAVDGLALSPLEEGIGAIARVSVRDAFAQDVFLGANVAVQAWYFPASGEGLTAVGTLLDDSHDGSFEGAIAFDERERDAMIVAWAEATNALDGFAHSGFAELPLGRCATDACLTT